MSGYRNHLPDTSVFDLRITGLNQPGLILLAARPGMGKTSLALNIARHVAETEGGTVMVFSLDMSREQLSDRLLSSEKLTGTAGMLRSLDIRIDDDPFVSAAEMSARCHRIDKLSLVVIDYLQLLGFTGENGQNNENRRRVMLDQFRRLKTMAEELHVPVLCLSQLSRAIDKRKDRRPILSDILGPGDIAREADVILFLYRDGYYNENAGPNNTAECIIAKNCHGGTGTVNLRWMPEYTRFILPQGGSV